MWNLVAKAEGEGSGAAWVRTRARTSARLTGAGAGSWGLRRPCCRSPQKRSRARSPEWSSGGSTPSHTAIYRHALPASYNHDSNYIFHAFDTLAIIVDASSPRSDALLIWRTKLTQGKHTHPPSCTTSTLAYLCHTHQADEGRPFGPPGPAGRSPFPRDRTPRTPRASPDLSATSAATPDEDHPTRPGTHGSNSYHIL